MKPLAFDVFLSRNNRAMEKLPKIKPPTTTVRLPPPLHAEIKEAAAKAGHSMNDEIIMRLESHTQAIAFSELSEQNAALQRMIQQLIDGLL